MQRNLRLARPFFLMLAIVVTGRWMQSLFGVPYERGHHVFSIFILTIYSAVFYGVFTRRWKGYRLLEAVMLGALMGLTAQVLILLSTVVSYSLDLRTFFNHPTALNQPVAVPFATALGIRAGGLVGGSITAGIAGAVGWAIGGLLPED
jgi:hypothetical protein